MTLLEDRWTCSAASYQAPRLPGTGMAPRLEETLAKWRAANPKRSSVPHYPAGYRPCLFRGCMVFIETGQERIFCYGHGGEPNPRAKRVFAVEDFAEYTADLRRKRAQRA